MATIDEVMTRNPTTLDAGSSLLDAARAMREADIGDVIVVREERVAGIVTDRDIVVRALAEGRDPASTTVGDICSTEVTTLTPDSAVEDAISLMREKAIRRLPVVRDGKPVGVVSIGDLAQRRDPDSALADISGAPPNR